MVSRFAVPNWWKTVKEWSRAARRSPPRGEVAPRPGRATPRLECLEDRTVPSTFTVTNTNDTGGGSLRQAVLDANALAGPDVIDFALAPADHTIALSGGELAITDSLAINGPGADQLTVSGSGLSRVLSVSNTGSSVTEVDLRGLTLTGGLAAEGGGILNTGGVLTLTDVVLSGNRATGVTGADGGGGGSGLGGGIANEGGTLTLVHSTLADNIAQGGAGGAGAQGTSYSGSGPGVIGGAGGPGGQGAAGSVAVSTMPAAPSRWSTACSTATRPLEGPGGPVATAARGPTRGRAPPAAALAVRAAGAA